MNGGIIMKRNKEYGDLHRLMKTFNDKKYINYYEVNSRNIFFKKEQLEKFIEDILKSLQSSNIHKHIDMAFTGFSDGTVVDYALHSFHLYDFDIHSSDESFFAEKISSIDGIKKFISCGNTDIFELIENIPFFDNIKYLNLNDYDIDFNSVVNLEPINFDSIKYLFNEQFKEISCGFYKKVYRPVGQAYLLNICDKDIVYYNLKLVYNYIYLIYNEIISKNDESMKFLCKINDLPDYFPVIYTDIELLSHYCAYNEFYWSCLNCDYMEEKDKVKFSFKDIVLHGLKYNPNFYSYLDENLTKDKEICKTLLDLDVEYFSLICRFGLYNNDDLKSYILKYFE